MVDIMIKQDIFYAAFERGFGLVPGSSLVTRLRGKIPKYQVMVGDVELIFWFKVNSKASAIPHQPGQFWPSVEAEGLARNERDNGIISWYQYTVQSELEELKKLQWVVFEKVKAQTNFQNPTWHKLLAEYLPVMQKSVCLEFKINSPTTPFYYLDEADAEAWGELLARHLVTWLNRFQARPETLDDYMWRVHWRPAQS